MSTRETVLAAVHATLSGLCGGRVYRSRKDQLPTVPAIVIRPEDEEDTGELLGVTDTTLTISVEIYARGETPDLAAYATLSSAYAQLAASSDLGLGSNVQILPGRTVAWAEDNYSDCSAILRIRIIYRTAQGAM